MTRRVLKAAGLALSLAAVAGAAHAQRGRGGSPYPEQSGEEIYKTVCQGCHMPDAKGAQGAGIYPALAGNKKLAAKAYPALVIVRGQKAMPEFGTAFSDMQVANVVNYVRTHFGNDYSDAITPDEVKPLHPKRAGGEIKPPG
jgi:mono/diheme cytochrome c family protein